MTLFKSKRKLKKDLQIAKKDLQEASSLRFAWQKAAEAAKKDAQQWRAQAELAQLTPQIKADIESAFMRGAQFTKKRALSEVYALLNTIDITAEVSDAIADAEAFRNQQSAPKETPPTSA